jgi:hypothetical protein
MNGRGLRAHPLVGLGLAVVAALTACGGGSSGPPPPAASLQLALSPSPATIVAGNGATLTAQLTRGDDGNAVSLQVAGLPTGVTVQITQPGAGNSGSIVLTAAATAAAGAYTLEATAADSQTSATASLALTVAVAAQIGAASAGSSYQTFFSTNFPLLGQSTFFTHANGAGLLSGLAPQHLRIMLEQAASPETAPDTWNFSSLDAWMRTLQTFGDGSPELQLARAPGFLYDANGNLLDPTYQQFATYATQLLQYYNLGGFTDQGQTYASPIAAPITWWGIYNEPEINNLTASQYAQLYNVTAAAMLKLDPGIKLVALEGAAKAGDLGSYLSTFLAQASEPMSAIALHFYGGCALPADMDDEQVFANVAGGSTSFVTLLQTAQQALAQVPGDSALPIWITEDNVNADYEKQTTGLDACEQKPWVQDARTQDAFFAAWRPFVFSQMVKHGAGALYQYQFDDKVFSEVDETTAAPYLSYWVDEQLSQDMAVPAGETYTLLPATTSDGTVEVMAAERPDGSVAIMISDHAVAAPTDVDGAGLPRTVVLDLSALSGFRSGTLTTIDAATVGAQGPQPTLLTPAASMTVTLPGYGVAFLVLKP